MRLFCKLSSLGSSDLYHFGETRSVLSWETIVHYPRYKLRGQIRLKDRTLSLGSDLLFNHCLYYRFVSFKYFMFLILNEHGKYNLKTNFLFFFVSGRFVFTAVSELIFLRLQFLFCWIQIFGRLLSFRTAVSEFNFFLRLQFLL